MNPSSQSMSEDASKFSERTTKNMNILCRLETGDWSREDENILESCLHQTVALYDNLDSNQTRKIATRRQL